MIRAHRKQIPIKLHLIHLLPMLIQNSFSFLPHPQQTNSPIFHPYNHTLLPNTTTSSQRTLKQHNPNYLPSNIPNLQSSISGNSNKTINSNPSTPINHPSMSFHKQYILILTIKQSPISISTNTQNKRVIRRKLNSSNSKRMSSQSSYFLKIL